MRSRRRPLIALFALAMGAIAAPVAAHAAVRTLAGDVDSVWAAARAALRSDGWDIADEDRARGRIVTGARDINFREFGLYAEGMRHRLLVSVAPVGGGLTSVTVERQLYWEERLLWDSVRRPVTPPSD